MGLFKKAILKVTGYKEIEFNVAGVSFKNGRKTRQALIRAIKYQDPPYHKEVNITLERYDYEGSLAIGVYANGEQLGNVPADRVAEVDAAWKSRYTITHYEVLGSGKTAPFGFKVRILFE